MTDVLTPEQRSYCMSRIRSRWTTQEVKVHNWLKGCKIRHKMHPKIDGGPDIILKDSKTAIFIHGCFWHKCPECYREPKSNREFWLPKIDRNVERDAKNKKILEKNGWKVMILWEHEIKKDPDAFVKKFIKKLNRL